MVTFANSGMNNRRLEQILQGLGDRLEGTVGCWEVSYRNHHLMVLTDESHNRMRVMTPIVAADQLSGEEMHTLLAANFDRALDAKYAISRGYLWAVFVHPLRELSELQLCDAVHQVATLAENYGGTYSSSDLVFGNESLPSGTENNELDDQI